MNQFLLLVDFFSCVYHRRERTLTLNRKNLGREVEVFSLTIYELNHKRIPTDLFDGSLHNQE